MLCKNTKATGHSDGNTDFVAIITTVLQGSSLALSLFIISLDYIQ